MAPPRRLIPTVARTIRFEQTDIVMLDAVAVRLGERDGSNAIRRLIRDAYAEGSATVAAPRVAKAVQRAEKPVGVAPKAFGHPKPGKGKR